MSLEHLHVNCEMKADDTEGAAAGTVLGNGSVFHNVDLGKDVVLPGASAGTTVRKVRMLWHTTPTIRPKGEGRGKQEVLVASADA